MSDKNRKEIEEKLDANAWDLIRICSGRDEDQIPRSIGVFAIDSIEDDSGMIKRLKKYELPNASYSIFASGGCVVVEAEVPVDHQELAEEMVRDTKILINKDQFRAASEILSLSLMPVSLSGSFVLLFYGMAYIEGYSNNFETYKIIMAFDNTLSCPVYDEDVSPTEIIADIDAEIEAMNQEEEEKIAALEDEAKKLEEEYMYQVMVQEMIMGNNSTNKGEREEPAESGVRVAKDDEKN